MALNYDTVENWTLDDIAVWLHVVKLEHHIKEFEKAGVTGKTLLSIDETFIQSKLKITSPSSQLILKQAIDQLNGDARKKVLMNKRASDVGPTLPLGVVPPTVTSTFNRHEKRNQTMPPRMTLHHLPPPPAPLNKSAKELMEYKCKYSGQIKKQGGQHKSCELLSVIPATFCLLCAIELLLQNDIFTFSSHLCCCACGCVCAIFEIPVQCLYAHVFAYMVCSGAYFSVQGRKDFSSYRRAVSTTLSIIKQLRPKELSP